MLVIKKNISAARTWHAQGQRHAVGEGGGGGTRMSTTRGAARHCGANARTADQCLVLVYAMAYDLRIMEGMCLNSDRTATPAHTHASNHPGATCKPHRHDTLSTQTNVKKLC